MHKNRIRDIVISSKTIGIQRLSFAEWLAQLLRSLPEPASEWSTFKTEKIGGSMVSDIVTYGLLASIFIVNGLRIFIEKPPRVSIRPVRLFERFRKTENAKTVSLDS